MTHSQYSWVSSRTRHVSRAKGLQRLKKRMHARLYSNSWLRRRSKPHHPKAVLSDDAQPCQLRIKKPRTVRTPSILPKVNRPRLLVVGFGDIAHRLAQYLGSRVQIVALSRSRPSASNVLWKSIDLDTPSLGYFPKRGYIGMIYLAPPPAQGTNDPRIQRLLSTIHVKRAVYISTTGVYGHQEGQWIDETQPVSPRSDRAFRRVVAENLFRRWGKHRGRRGIILRAPGIYAHNRLPIDRLKAGTPVLHHQDDVYTNHIHAYDLARLTWLALFKGRPQRTYNACDHTAMKMGDYFDAVAKAFGLNCPPRVPRSSLIETVSPMQRSFMEESRRLRNDRICNELGFRFRHPNLESWLEDAAKMNVLKN